MNVLEKISLIFIMIGMGGIFSAKSENEILGFFVTLVSSFLFIASGDHS